MATYAIGDIQGCFQSFLQLLRKINFDPQHDRLWLVGDIINRGTGSLPMLRWVYEHQHLLDVVLGNHDLHAIAVAEGYVPLHEFDTLHPLLDAADSDQLFEWLRHQPLVHWAQGYLMVHAGLLPQWNRDDALALAAEVEQTLRGRQYREFLAHMYGNRPLEWRDDLQGMDRLRLITNAMTRIRTCTPTGALNFEFSGRLADVPAGYLPWFELPYRKSVDSTVIFGHWSALGLQRRDNLFALDTGCLWGGKLTALRLEDQAVFQVDCVAGDSARTVHDFMLD